MRLSYSNFFNKLEETDAIKSIRNGLVMVIPILMLGSFSLLFKSLPIAQYQQFLKNFGEGILVDLFSTIYNATFGMLSLYMVLSISISLNRVKDMKGGSIGAPLTALTCFILISGILIEDSSSVTDNFGIDSMFTAIFISLTSTYMYFFLKKIIDHKLKLLISGVDTVFNDTVSIIFPFIFVVLIYSVLDMFIVHNFNVSSFNAFLIGISNNALSHLSCSLGSAICFVFISTLLWFFGIHGSDALESVNQNLFLPAMQDNVNHLIMGMPATEIFSKTFFDVFILMGGCGSSLCLLAALLLFSKRKKNRNLAKLSVFPMIFNINELMIFGLPVAFNYLLFIPFMLTPLVCLFTAYIAMKTGIVPIPTVQVEWTTPIFLGGYLATGSVRGCALQLFNLIVGIFIYKPYVCAYDQEILKAGYKNLESLITLFKNNEKNNVPMVLTDMSDSVGTVAKLLAAHLKNTIDEKKIDMHYQPQHDNKEHCIGAEALLRWKHPVFGIIYPPLIIKLAEEAQILEELEECIFEVVAQHIEQINHKAQRKYTICVNVSPQTIQRQSFIEFLRQFTIINKIKKHQICIEITEQDTLMLNENLHKILVEIHEMGYLLAIDDFSMGSTSIKYLQNNRFDLVKLDGSLVKEIDSNIRSRNIVSSIIYLADSLGFSVLAEYVESREKQIALERIGCLKYQGYLYSPAIPIENFIDYLKKN
ncbi:PTS sugar transporter subunit IIC/EAL domain-containing protein [Aminipila sp.]|uniref:PTS sugar transporter subunit IIC/EAL domain-containing protein n=1 Tax=Aminipila sp. TaxID=2060095 RepID=UPI0028A07125|nr:EAL domain-containing protein [Aminipila sp.]